VKEGDKGSSVDEQCLSPATFGQYREFQAVKLAAVQMVAIKTLASVLSCGRFKEMLLVPRYNVALCAHFVDSSFPYPSNVFFSIP
jgi:hypothetical protein